MLEQTLVGENMASAPQLITKEIYDKASKRLKTINKISRAGIRLQAIVSAKTHGVGVAARVFGVSQNTLRAWVKSFVNEDIVGLDYKSGRGRKSALLNSYLEVVAKLVQDDCNITLNQIVQKLLETHNVITSKSAVHRALHKLNLSYITPRPVHHKQKIETHHEFKKKSN
jgi:transposase